MIGSDLPSSPTPINLPPATLTSPSFLAQTQAVDKSQVHLLGLMVGRPGEMGNVGNEGMTLENGRCGGGSLRHLAADEDPGRDLKDSCSLA